MRVKKNCSMARFFHTLQRCIASWQAIRLAQALRM